MRISFKLRVPRFRTSVPARPGGTWRLTTTPPPDALHTKSHTEPYGEMR